MKLMSFTHAGHTTWGAAIDKGVIDLGRVTGQPTLAAFIASADYARRAERVVGRTADFVLADVVFLPVIPQADSLWRRLTV